MDIITLGIALVGVVVGALLGFFSGKGMLGKANQAKIDEVNAKADLTLKEARLTAQRKIDEAETKATKMIARAEAKNEAMKNRKISEAKQKFNRFRSEFDKDKAKHKLELKDREVDVVNKEKDLKRKLDQFKNQKQDLMSYMIGGLDNPKTTKNVSRVEKRNWR